MRPRFVRTVLASAMTAATAATAALSASNANAFCGFYVSKADTTLFNHASQVVLARDQDRTVITMANDFRGDVKDFAIVIPVPTLLTREQIHVADPNLISHLDAYTSPRLVEYFDGNPCMQVMKDMAPAMGRLEESAASERERDARANGVTIEARYTVGEYDILILSAKQSDGLIMWLKDNGYRLPRGAEPVINSYLKQDMHFFVAKVNLVEQARSGFSALRPLQIAYEHPRFMLPIRLGTVNANGAQELFVYALTRTGRVETANYPTVRIPSDVNLPPYIKADFPHFYRDMFGKQTLANDGRVVFLEYAWDMNWCDPCAADPLAQNELRELGVSWLEDATTNRIAPQGSNTFVTRLHVRYDGEHFPEDLAFKETGDRTNFQGRYILQQAWQGAAECPAAHDYFARVLPERQQHEARTLAELTGWSLDDIRQRLPPTSVSSGATEDRDPWWKRIWR